MQIDAKAIVGPKSEIKANVPIIPSVASNAKPKKTSGLLISASAGVRCR
jgi:hypothetical protein